MWVPVLIYHRVTNDVTEESRPLCVHPSAFEKQMKFLRRHGFRTVSLQDVASAMAGDTKLPDKAIAITFDDGYRDTYFNAFPILLGYGFTATVFLVSSLIGRTNEWDQREHAMRPVKLLSLPEIREMSKSGIIFGSHSRSHRRLICCTPKETTGEILGSKEELQDLLGCEVQFFCYPYCAVDMRVSEAVRSAGYVAACCGHCWNPESQLYHIARMSIAHDNWLVARFKLLGWHRRLRSNPALHALKGCSTTELVLIASVLRIRDAWF